MTQDTLFKLRLNTISYAANDTNLYRFSHPENIVLPPAEPGAHVGLHLPNGLVRQYSLIESGNNLTSYLVGIKRDANGQGGSKYIHDSLRVGTLIDVEAPRNNFPLIEGSEHSILIAGGIGITPIYSMFKQLQQLGQQCSLYYACRSRNDAIFLEELTEFKNVHFHFDDESNEPFLNIPNIVKQAPSSAHFYCCGPGPMLSGFEEALASHPPELVHLEYFSQKEAAAIEGGFTVVLAKSAKEVAVAPGQTILNVLLDAGIDMPFSCEQGICGSCEVNVLEGTPDHRDAILSDSERAAGKTMMVCCSGSKSDKLILDV